MTTQRFTTDEVSAVASGKCEFCDVPGLKERFGIKRSLAYKLLNEGVIHGISLRRGKSKRGKRLFQIESVRKFLKECDDNP
jgi:hypothetical protein